MLFCWQMDWVRETFYFTSFRSMAMRFVEGGSALRTNGISLLGHEMNSGVTAKIDYAEEIEFIVDNAYVTCTIMRGLLWMVLCLGWISFANIKCIRLKDYRLLLVSCCMLVFALMERPGLDVWFNFVMLYPLSRADIEPGRKEHDPQQPEEAEQTESFS